MVKRQIIKAEELPQFSVQERQDKIDQLTIPTIEQIAHPSTFSEQYTPEDYEDLKTAYTALIAEQKEDTLSVVYENLKEQLQNLLSFQQEQQQQIIQQQEKVNIAQSQQIRKFEENMQNIQQQVNDFTAKYSDTLARCLDTITANKSSSKSSSQQIKKLQQDLQREKQFINGDIELFIGWQKDCINLLQKLTNIVILPGKQFSEEAINEYYTKMNGSVKQNYYIVRDDLQLKMQYLNNQYVITPVQRPSNIIYDEEAQQKFADDTIIDDPSILKDIWKSICEEYVKYYQVKYPLKEE